MILSASESDAWCVRLREAGLVHSPQPILEPLPGGVSSEIILVTDGDVRFVVKRALAKLRVRDEWFADISRSRSELAYLRRAEEIVQGSTPRVLYAPTSGDWFAMEYLGSEFLNWKTLLLDGRTDPQHARRAGALLGNIHRATWQSAEAARQFATLENFRQLRLEPYFDTTARRVPELAPQIFATSEEIARTELALVHGDFSPKNILLSPDRFVILDAEVAWFGDPAFDAAFLITHFLLKALRQSAKADSFLELAAVFRHEYQNTLGTARAADLEPRTVRVVLCLMLARVHGKSPVEYLDAPRQMTVTSFVRSQLPSPPQGIFGLINAWRSSLFS